MTTVTTAPSATALAAAEAAVAHSFAVMAKRANGEMAGMDKDDEEGDEDEYSSDEEGDYNSDDDDDDDEGGTTTDGGGAGNGGSAKGRKTVHPLSLAASAAVVAGTTVLVSFCC